MSAMRRACVSAKLGRLAKLGGLAVLSGLAACGSDPAALGITGPATQIVPPRESSATGGASPTGGTAIGSEPIAPDGAMGGRFWRYN